MPAVDTTGGRILLVDDDPSILKSYGHSLREAGFEVTEASVGEEAVERLEHESFDVVLSDISMPQIDGLTLLRRLRERYLDLPVILMSDALDNGAAIKAVAQGALQCLVKPIAANVLEEVADYAVRRHRSRHVWLAGLRTRRGARIPACSFSATDAKNEFGRLLDTAIQEGAVVITKHDMPKAVLLSLDEFNALAHRDQGRLETLSGEFDALLARMQTPEARAGMKAAFDASPAQLGKAALAAARKRG